MIQKQITVNLGERSYPVYTGRDMLSSLPRTLDLHKIAKDVVLVTDGRVARFYAATVEKHLRHAGFRVTAIVVPPGEGQKNLQRASKIFTEMLAAGIGRNSALIALGGGVIGDLAGFVAATYQRGIPLVQVPTTLLAQVDSSVGGKVAVNHPLGKNMIGAFYQPVFVWADTDLLRTLPFREVVCGIGEIVKYGVALDKDLFAFLETNLNGILKLDPEPIHYVRSRCVELKSDIVSRDEKELGLRSVLNLGHTVAHALESAGKYRLLKHGEAVLLGIVAEGHIARQLGMIDQAILDRIVTLIQRIPVKAAINGLAVNDILKAISRDKKAVGRTNRFVLPTRMGETTIAENVDLRLVVDSLKYLRTLKRVPTL
ncbi:MAG TPA: 3-dehydroquinate synthase [Bacteroidota bacterium]